MAIHRNCGGTILVGGQGKSEHMYCDRCAAFRYRDMESDLPTGTDPEVNRAAWDAGKDSSPDAISTAATLGRKGGQAKSERKTDRRTGPAPLARVLVTGAWLFDGDLATAAVTAYTDGTRWNGWAMPRVERSVVQKLMERSFASGSVVWTWGDHGALLVNFTDSGRAASVLPSFVDTVDGLKHLYDVSLGLTWQTVEADEVGEVW